MRSTCSSPSPDGGILNDPVLLRVEEDEFWLSLADSDVNLYALGIAAAKGMDVTVQEIDVAPVQIQGPNAKKVLTELFGDRILDVPYYGLMKAELDGMQVVISRTGYTGEVGYEIYLRDASEHGVKLWDGVLEAGKPHDLEVIGPCHIRRIEGGSWPSARTCGTRTTPSRSATTTRGWSTSSRRPTSWARRP